MSSWHSYPSTFNLGHRAVKDLLSSGPVIVEEKIDGSQFSFGLFPDDPHGPLLVRSKGAVMNIEAPEKMFSLAANTVLKLHGDGLLREGWTYRAEYLRSPKHNTLAYDRFPNQHLIIFDINDGDESFLSYDAKAEAAQAMGLEVVPRLFEGNLKTADQVRTFLETVSVLGGQKIEGVVIKPVGYNLFGQDKKALLGKFVSEAFKEIHRESWKRENPGPSDIVSMVAGRYTTAARWNKCAQHLRDDGKITGDSVKDIGPIMKEIPDDILKECGEDIKDALFKAFWPEIARKVRAGFPEYYKEQLLKQQFNEESTE